jgi:isocitrate/isopropylmalate dehydrogenase
MRQQLDIYASLVVCKTLPGFPTRHKDVDFAIIRENTEGEYSGLEHQVRLSPPTDGGADTNTSDAIVIPWSCRVTQGID